MAALASLAFDAAPGATTRLGEVAAALAPGEFARLQTSNFGLPVLRVGNRNSILEYAGKGVWDPARGELDFLGQGHDGGRKHIRYRAETNAWTVLPEPPYVGHAYEHVAIDTTRGEVYLRAIGSLQFDRYAKASARWSKLPALPDVVHQVAGAIEFFPELGGLVFVDSVAGVWLFDVEEAAWERLAPAPPMGHIHNFASYNPVHQVVLFGGGNGSSRVYRLDRDARITRVADTPDGQTLGPSSRQGRIAADPVSGEYLAFFGDGGFHAYDVARNRWRALGRHPVAEAAREWFAATPISTYGVVLLMAWNFEQSSVHLYRHAAAAH